jgi:Tat protein translocase TatB subunit
MLDFGFSEILLTSAIALVVLGPEKLPKVARQVGNWMGRARLMARQLSEQLEREVNAEELLKQAKISPPAPPVPPAALAAPSATLPSTGEAPSPAAPPPIDRPPRKLHPTSAAAMHPQPAPSEAAPPVEPTQTAQ